LLATALWTELPCPFDDGSLRGGQMVRLTATLFE